MSYTASVRLSRSRGYNPLGRKWIRVRHNLYIHCDKRGVVPVGCLMELQRIWERLPGGVHDSGGDASLFLFDREG